MKRLHYLLISIFTVGILMTTSLKADTELENESLARIVQVLDSLTPIIDEAQRQADNNSRIQFQYDALRSDINKIKGGIEQKLNPPALEPRIIAPIQGDYLKSKQ